MRWPRLPINQEWCQLAAFDTGRRYKTQKPARPKRVTEPAGKLNKTGHVMTSIMIDMFLLGLLVFIAVMILRTGKLFAVIVMSGGYRYL